MQSNSTQKDSSDEWTFVSNKKKTKKQVKEKHLAKAKRQLHLLQYSDHDLNDQQQTYDPTENEVDDLVANIEECMKSLELLHPNMRQDRRDVTPLNFVQELLNTITKATDFKNLQSVSKIKSVSPKKRKVQEIICYGIGNFSKASYSTLQSTSYSSPMIQISCALLLRKKLATKSRILENDTQSLYEDHQSSIPMRYYEPLINPVERKVLQHFNVELLENEQGKRQIGTIQNINNEETRDDSFGISLFFMPHCPMRLYSNLLWANWEPSKISRIVIFGNSFKAYDDRIMAFDQRNDCTNAIFPILEYVQEYTIPSIGDHVKKMNHLDIDTSISLAFNDCVLMSFDVFKDGICWPDRPMEYLVKDDSLDSEII
jgi:hypothetical protein